MPVIEVHATLKVGRSKPDTVFGPYAAMSEDAARQWMKSFANMVADGAANAEFGPVGGKKNNILLTGWVTVDGKKKHTLTAENIDVPDANLPVVEQACSTFAATMPAKKKP